MNNCKYLILFFKKKIDELLDGKSLVESYVETH